MHFAFRARCSQPTIPREFEDFLFCEGTGRRFGGHMQRPVTFLFGTPSRAQPYSRALDEMIRLSPTNKDSGSFKEEAHRLACARMLICTCNCMRVPASYGVRARARACVCVFACACVCARAMCTCAYVHAMCFVLCACCACVHARACRRTHGLKPLLMDGAFRKHQRCLVARFTSATACGEGARGS